MTLRLGTPRCALVVAPHSDDEVIGAGKLIAALRRRGTRVSVVIVSDGAASHPGSRRWPRRRLVAARRLESRRALARLGVDARAIVFLGLPDGALAASGTRCIRAVRRELARCRGLDLLVGPAADDHHPDHRAVAAALGGPVGRVRRLGYRVWPAQRARRGGTLRLPAAATTVAKRSLVRVYRTQSGAVKDDPTGFSIAPHQLAAFTHPVEWFEEVR